MSEINTIEDVRAYIQQDYWEKGLSSGISGYEGFTINWWWNGRLAQWLNSCFDLRGKDFLDLGCAYGGVVATATLFGARAKGIDISDYAIDAGKKNCDFIRDHIIQGSIHDLKVYNDNSFNILYSNQVFEHLPKEYCEQLAKETYRVAKKNCILWSALVLDISGKFQPEGRNPADHDKTHINIRPKQWWDDLMTSAGWNIADDVAETFKKIRVFPDGYSFFDTYRWHTICYKK